MLTNLSLPARRFVSAWLHWDWPDDVTPTDRQLAGRALYGAERPDAEHWAFCIALDLQKQGLDELAQDQWGVIDAAGARQHADEARQHLVVMFTWVDAIRNASGKRPH